MSPLQRYAALAWQSALICVLSVLYPHPSAGAVASAVTPPMNKLFRTFVGDWTVVETFQRNEFFSKGGERRGTARFTVGTGGTSLIEDYHSDGSAGKLDFLLVIWWDAPAKVYKVFTCSNGSDNAGELRGSAHWERGTLINDYEEKVQGKEQKFQDRFSELTSGSFTLVAGVDRDAKTFEPLITTTYRRKTNPTVRARPR